MTSSQALTATRAMSKPQTLVSHLLELRNCLIRTVVATLIVFVVLAAFSNEIYQLIASPLIDKLPENSSMIATEVAAPFLAPFKLTLFVALFLVMPYILYQAWQFIAPGLYDQEKRLAVPLLLSSIVLFYLGVAFSFFVVFPLLFGFLTATAPEGVAVMTDITHYLNFIIKLFFAFGMAFEVPILTIVLLRTGITDAASLREKRPYIIIAAFTVGMLLTPPDIISQVFLAIPVWILFELGLFFGERMIDNPNNAEEAQQDTHLDG